MQLKLRPVQLRLRLVQLRQRPVQLKLKPVQLRLRLVQLRQRAVQLRLRRVQLKLRPVQLTKVNALTMLYGDAGGASSIGPLPHFEAEVLVVRAARLGMAAPHLPAHACVPRAHGQLHWLAARHFLSPHPSPHLVLYVMGYHCSVH